MALRRSEGFSLHHVRNDAQEHIVEVESLTLLRTHNIIKMTKEIAVSLSRASLPLTAMGAAGTSKTTWEMNCRVLATSASPNRQAPRLTSSRPVRPEFGRAQISSTANSSRPEESSGQVF
jgi:hypothetical protein